ncbi:hypothetical protein AB1Y20_006215 [Prymnesium parvum]|uniref:phosphatidate phosphatase n=1 Tax=Prymnesium parvum TaxID=97485 RepID=A0AB34J457_PRYPA
MSLLMDSITILQDRASLAMDINPSTLSGAIDIIVVEQEDGSLRSTPFHIRFGKLQLLKPREKVVTITVNDVPTSLSMKLGYSGEAFFVTETFPSDDDHVPLAHLTSPPAARPDAGEVVEEFSLGHPPAAAPQAEADRQEVAVEPPFVAHAVEAAPALSVDMALGGDEFGRAPLPGRSKDKLRKSRRTASGEWDWGGFPEIIFSPTEPAPAAPPLGAVPTPVDEEAAWEEGEELAQLVAIAQTLGPDASPSELALQARESTLRANGEGRGGACLSRAFPPPPPLYAPTAARVASAAQLERDDIAAALAEVARRRAGSPPRAPRLAAPPALEAEAAAGGEGRRVVSLDWQAAGPASLRVRVRLEAARAASPSVSAATSASAGASHRSSRHSETDSPPPLLSCGEDGDESPPLLLSCREEAEERGVGEEDRQGVEAEKPVAEAAAAAAQVAAAVTREDSAAPAPSPLANFALSLCADAAADASTEWPAAAASADELRAFEAHRVSRAQFEAAPELLYRPELRVRVGDALLTWERAAPLVASLLAFGAPLDAVPPPAPGTSESDKHKRRKLEKRRSFPWFFGGWTSEKAPSGAHEEAALSEQLRDMKAALPSPARRMPDDAKAADIAGVDSADGAEGFFSSDGFELTVGTDGAATPPDRDRDRELRRRSFVKTLRPSSAQLEAMGLRLGANSIKFSVLSGSRQVAVVQSRIFLFKPSTRLVISDVDGTITKSDVLGHLMPRVGYDWSHKGVTSLYEAITANGYQMIYLTARGIGMAGTTRDYLSSIQQADASVLPEGPCLLSPTRLIESLTREVIRRKPEEFKIACLQDIRSLWPSGQNPFYAGFGNRSSDVVAYREAGVPPARILVINPQGEIHTSMRERYCWATYPRLLELCNQMFPPLNQDDEYVAEEFNAYNFWHIPPQPLRPHNGNTQVPDRQGSALGANTPSNTPAQPVLDNSSSDGGQNAENQP